MADKRRFDLFAEWVVGRWPDRPRVFDVAGGTAIYDTNPLQEIFRDSTAGASHLSLTWQRAAPPYGQLKLGQTVDYDAI